MANTDKHAPGTVSWIELSTLDQDGAKAFYTSLLNWTVQDNPIQGGVYTMFQRNGRKAAAVYTMMPDEQAMGIPPHWNVYFAVESADQAAARAAELGAKILAPPFDVMEHGRMSVIQDPQGAVFCVWQAKQHEGLEIEREANTYCWLDLNTPDQAAGARFYGDFFGWEFEPGDTGYLHIKHGQEMMGGIPSAEQLPPNVPPHWVIYIQVDDCDNSTAKAKELGAKICFGPITLENVGRFSMIMDPQGAGLYLFQPFPRV